MMHCRIRPITLEEAARSEEAWDDSDLVLNHMIAIAHTPMSDYFCHRADDLEKLACICDLKPCELAKKSYGEVADLVAVICQDSIVTGHHGREGREYSTRAINAIRTFVGPIAFASLTVCGQPDCFRLCKPRELDSTVLHPRASGNEEGRLSLTEEIPLNYFQDHFATRKVRRSSECTMAKAFSFSAKNYREAVAHVLGRSDLLGNALASLGVDFEGEEDKESLSLLRLICYVSIECGDAIERALDYNRTIAYDAMFLLLIAPYALISKGHEPFKRYVAATHQSDTSCFPDEPDAPPF